MPSVVPYGVQFWIDLQQARCERKRIFTPIVRLFLLDTKVV
jgi:hypothetical protein